ncbi:MAG: zinc-ribbon domain-containing protein [Subdoligranulum sp.]|nr:zinc-ribbon domain-containing protein [Subdoligranulum sp.]
MYCSKCGAKLEDGAAFCPACGTPVGGTAAQPNAPAQAAAMREKAEPAKEAPAKAGKKSTGVLIGVLAGCLAVLLLIFAVGGAMSNRTTASGSDGPSGDDGAGYSDADGGDDGAAADAPNSVSAPGAPDAADADGMGLDLSEFADLDPAYTQLFLRAMAPSVYSGAEGFEDYCLFGDESVTIGELLYGIFGEHEWIDDSQNYEEADAASVSIDLNGEQYKLYFVNFYGRITIEGYSGASEGALGLDSEYGTANLLYRLCQYYHTYVRNIPMVSRVSSMYGDWQSEDGSVVLTITPDTYGGDSYEINLISDDGICVNITRSNGNIDSRVLMLSTDLSVMYIYENEFMGYAGELVGTFFRAG